MAVEEKVRMTEGRRLAGRRKSLLFPACLQVRWLSGATESIEKEISMSRSGEFMTRLRTPPWLVLAAFLLLAGCAHRPINPPITKADPKTGYRYLTRPQY